MIQTKIKSKNHKKALYFMVSVIVIITITISLNSKAYPDENTLGCHPGGYTISVNTSTIETELSSSYILEVIGTGQGVVIDVYAGVKHNDLFTILPSNIIIDNSPDDLNPAANSIRVNLNITVPSQEGIFTLRILSRASTFAGEDTGLTLVDVKVMVGEVTVTKTPLTIFIENYNIYFSGIALIFMGIGTIIFQINLNRKEESKAHGIFMTIGFILITVNMFLILDDTVINGLGVNQLIHFSLGSVGYMAGILAVFGTYTHVPRQKMKLAIYLMLLGWSFNFLFGIFVPTPILV
ncbi:MAG TPA: hypothetical protein ENH75_09285 [archaeon]|nr:hypothetical protein [archaeon]